MHGTLSHVTRSYLHKCMDPATGMRKVMRRVNLPYALAEEIGKRLLNRPLFVEQQLMQQATADITRLYSLLASLPERLFGGDMAAYCTALRIDEGKAKLIGPSRVAFPPMYGRADMYHDGNSFKLLEFNAGSDHGGINTAGQLARTLADTEPFTSFAEEFGLRFVDTGALMAGKLRELARSVKPDGEPAIALLDGPGGMKRFAPVWRSMREMMRSFGLDFHIGEIEEVEEKNGRLFLRGARIDAVLRHFSTNELMSGDAESMLRPIHRAREAGHLALCVPLESELISNKGCLALLADPAAQPSLSVADRELIARLIPWTRLIPRTPTGFGYGFRELVAEARERKDSLILKPVDDYGGSGVMAGWAVGDAEWSAALESAYVRGAVIQERVTPNPVPVPDARSGVAKGWQPVWGVFVNPDGYSGSSARAIPEGSSPIIGMTATKSARLGPVFTYENNS